MPSSLVTSLLWIEPTESLVVKVVGAEPSATTYLLGCTPEPDSRDNTDCSLYYVALTLGPWASETPPPGAARTGDFDLYISDSIDPWKYSMHCEMSGTVAQKCTTINIGGNDDGHPTATFGSEEELEEEDLIGLGYATVTITEGLEFLAATHSGSHETATASTEDTSASAQSTAETAASATAASSETSGTESSSGTSTPEATSVASSCKARVFTAMSVAGVAMAVVFS
ncbi:hypothetical protein NCS57_01375200 [Fusarium keratoplasticum]|uniref:Uncharacterized protein n=1 Tax=Fusarium keratoplasticum TaxID=1328300 RepID=A0ACC0QE08_9HYPO|nr:hypothetical protein NCS57_01375200 [Fusarium keratoplasticum]KAI8650415.1 hypothetical protein NCS57_01375200 [Fusarium keratoplasticum]KAI8651238.1 hypothetical protein NCS55_01367600 [Fusarium keratoplasticum]